MPFSSRVLALPVLLAGLGAAIGLPHEAAAAEASDARFLQTVSGTWSGPGEIVAGKYKGTKFVCNFIGSTPQGKVGLTLDGGCRVGIFTQKMKASVERKGRNGFVGTFLDGAEGSGLDVESGNIVDGKKVVLALHRKQLRGVMQARLADEDAMIVTISVRVQDQMVPVIGVSLKRTDDTAVGAIARN